MLVVAVFVVGLVAGFAIGYFGVIAPVLTFFYVGLTVTDLEPSSWSIAVPAAAISLMGVVVGLAVRDRYDRMRES